jgi:hypothetical protein
MSECQQFFALPDIGFLSLLQIAMSQSTFMLQKGTDLPNSGSNRLKCNPPLDLLALNFGL